MSKTIIFKVRKAKLSRVLNLSKKWYEWASRETCISRDEMWIRGFIRRGIKTVATVPDRKIHAYFVDEKSFLRSHEIFEAYLRHNWQNHLRMYAKRQSNLMQSVNNLNLSLASSRRVIAQKYKKVIQSADEWNDYIFGAWSIIYVTEPYVSRHLPKDLETILALDRPIKFMELQRMIFQRPLAEAVKKYWWLNMYNSYDKPYSEKSLRQLKSKTDIKEIERAYKIFPRIRNDFHGLLKKIRSPLLRQRAIMAHEYAFLKTDRVDTWRWLHGNLVQFYVWLAREMKMPFRHILECYQEEVMAFLEMNTRPFIDDLDKRLTDAWASVYTVSGVNTVIGRKNVSSLRRKITCLLAANTEISGTTASKGKATGRVQIIHSAKELHRIRPGDILFARFTYPSYTTVMRRCAAIVTDDGGLTSHAAIVARELGIPCVVGTGQATRVFKNGDRVEVDAFIGIVKRL